MPAVEEVRCRDEVPSWLWILFSLLVWHGNVAKRGRGRDFNFSGSNSVSCISVSTEEDDDDDDGGGFAMTDIGRESSSAAIVGVCNFIFLFLSLLLQVCLFVCFVLWGDGSGGPRVSIVVFGPGNG